MKQTLITGLALLLAPAATWADDAGLRQCRAIGNPVARLACYDALALPPAPVPAAPPSAPAAAPPSAPSPAALESQFGLASPVERVQEVVTRYEGQFEGWRPNERIRLANGQVWQVVDGSSGVYDLKNPKVTVKRGALGRFILDVEGAGKMPGVRRVE